MIRFEGRASLTLAGWELTEEPDWGVSVLSYALDQIHRQAANEAAVGQMIQMASIIAIMIGGLGETVKGSMDPTEQGFEDKAHRITQNMSVFRTLFLSDDDKAEVLRMAFQGLAQVLQHEERLMAAIANIPVTRFMSDSPTGLDATGDSDSANYAMMVQSMREDLAEPVYRNSLDVAIARHMGLAEPPEYDWPGMMMEKPKQEAETEEIQVRSILAPVQLGLLDEEETRERLSKLKVFGELGPWAKPILLEEEEKREEEAQKQQALAKQNHPPPSQ